MQTARYRGRLVNNSASPMIKEASHGAISTGGMTHRKTEMTFSRSLLSGSVLCTSQNTSDGSVYVYINLQFEPA